MDYNIARFASIMSYLTRGYRSLVKTTFFQETSRQIPKKKSRKRIGIHELTRTYSFTDVSFLSGDILQLEVLRSLKCKLHFLLRRKKYHTLFLFLDHRCGQREAKVRRWDMRTLPCAVSGCISIRLQQKPNLNI